MKKKIIAIIPARIGSKGIKYKNLKKIGNMTLVERAIRFLKKIKLVNDIAVSTDSPKIRDIALKHNVWCKYLRPKSISKDTSKTSEAIYHVIKKKNKCMII